MIFQGVHVRCLSLLCLLWSGDCMFTKRARPNSQEVPEEKRLKHNVENLYLNNDVSAERAHSIFDDALKMKRPEQFTKLASSKVAGNMARDMRRRLLKGSRWPDVYYAKVRTWNPKENKMVRTWLPFLLPHELIKTLLLVNTKEALLQSDCMSQVTKDHVQKCSQALQDDVLGCGLWADGVPCNWDRTQSIEVVSINFPGIENLRLPICCINKKFLAKPFDTYDDIMSIVAWSFECLAVGVCPTSRHDGSGWTQQDTKRRKLAGSPIGMKAVLAEVRGDWACFKACFRLPGWNELRGCCWKCQVTPEGIRDFGENAPWRSMPLTHWDLMARMLQQYGSISPIFKCPYFVSGCFQMDWLHAVDLGVSAQFLGNLFWLCLPKLAGNTLQDRVGSLFQLIQQYYRDTDAENQLDALTVLMLCQPKKGPKLRGRAGEVRTLVPFGKRLAEDLLSDADQTELAAKECAKHLLACYDMLSSANFNPQVLQLHCKKFCLLYTTLESLAASPLLWKVKPKLHLFAEIAALGSNPSTLWTYRDEDFGGAAAKISHRRGGKNSVTSTGTTFLTKFLALYRIPSV